MERGGSIMYKITLWDNNIPSGGSGVFWCYCDDIDKFEEEWTKLERDEDTIARFRRSKAGELVTDYFPTSNDEELNIVQEDREAEVCFEKDIVFKDRKITLENAWGYPSDFWVQNLTIHVRYVRFKGEYLRQMSYSIKGFAYIGECKRHKYERYMCYGNPVLKHTHEKEVVDGSENIEDFSGECIESIVYYPMGCFTSFEDMKEYVDSDEISDEEIALLLIDIVGEAG